MHWRVILLVGLGISLLLGGCEHPISPSEGNSNGNSAVKSDQNLLDEYLAEAREDLPRNIFPITLDEVTVHSNIITTNFSIDTRGMNADDIAKAKKAISTSLREVFAGICTSIYFQPLIDQDFIFNLQATGSNINRTATMDGHITPSECRKAGVL